MPETIQLLDVGVTGAARTFILRIETAQRLPLTVGMSFRPWTKDERGYVTDIPARRLRQTGLVPWHLDQVPDNGMGQPRQEVRFSTWSDAAFTRRLADTGWIEQIPDVRYFTVDEYRAFIAANPEADCWELRATVR